MALESPYSNSKKQSYWRTTSVRLMTLTWLSTTAPRTKVCAHTSRVFLLFNNSDMNRIEYKDDSYTIPRSSTVVVKRVFAKPGKGKAAMYIGTPSSATQDGSKTGAGTPNGSYAWHRGNISKRFDGKEEPTTSSIPKPTSTSTPTVPEAS